jgi:hypothetical protein
MRKFVLITLVTVGVIGGLRYWQSGAEARRWAALSTTRERTAIARYLLPLDDLLSRELGVNLVIQPFSFGCYKENYLRCYGALHSWRSNEILGTCWPVFYFQDWQSEPTSAEVSFDVDPAKLVLSDSTEFSTLLRKTHETGEQRTQLAGIEWFSSEDKDKRIRVTLRVPYPSKWIPAIPEYDRGYSDEMYFDVARRVVRFLVREAFKSDYGSIYLDLPVYNPPPYVWNSRLGVVGGYIARRNGSLLSLDISTSESAGKSTLQVRIGPRHGTSGQWKLADAENLFKPEFLQKLGGRYENGLAFGPRDSSDFRFDLTCPLDVNLDQVRMATIGDAILDPL